MTSGEIREWIVAVGAMMGGIGAMWAAALARRQKEKNPDSPRSPRPRYGRPLPLTPAIRKQWDTTFTLVLAAFFIVILSIYSASRPDLDDWQVGTYVLGGMLLAGVYVWLASLFGRRAIWMHERRAVAEHCESMKEIPNQAHQHNAGDRPPMDDSPASESPSSPAPRG